MFDTKKQPLTVEELIDRKEHTARDDREPSRPTLMPIASDRAAARPPTFRAGPSPTTPTSPPATP